MDNKAEGLKESIAPFLLKIFKVMDGEKVVGIELTNGPERWFYSIDQEKWPSLRLGKFPRKSLDEEFERVLLFQFPEDPHAYMMFGQSLAEHLKRENPALDKVHLANQIYEFLQIDDPIGETDNGSNEE